MNILSLFDGMACGMLAMLDAGVKIDRYVAFEIDKYAVKTSTHNFPMIEHRGDVFKANFSEFEGFDWLVGGSPCTYWSIAQTKNRETEASGMGWELFSQYVRALRESKPMYFLYENNKSMSKAIRQSISETFGFEPICINSALVSAQNRQRLYWVGKRNHDGTYSQVPVKQPQDRGILLRDILESGVCWREKSYTLDANYYKTAGIYNPKKQHSYSRLMAAKPVVTTLDGKAFCVTATEYKGGELSDTLKRHRRTLIAEPVRVGTIENDAKNADFDSQQYRVYSPDGKSVTVCGQGGGVGAKLTEKANTLLAGQTHNEKVLVPVPNGKWKNVYEVRDGKITIKGIQYPIKLADGLYIIRKLTVTECKRLQTVPDDYIFPVSDTQAYKMLGNGWTVKVISHLIKLAVG